MPLLEIRNLVVRYGEIEALRGATVAVEEGQVVTLLGANGAGKSTTLRAISGLATVLIIFSMVIPYFTFGEDYKMMKQLGFDAIMLFTAIFGLLAASFSINEEIEGRTAITVMSKPINRRQFLIGKYVGTLMACWAMMMLLGWVLTWALYIKPHFDAMDDVLRMQSTKPGRM